MLERTIGPWDYRMMPNKMLELVKNVGNMEQEGTGYFVDSESEMLTILAYLNYDEKTNITEGMREQIDLAVETLEAKKLSREELDRRLFLNISLRNSLFVIYVIICKCMCLIYDCKTM